MSSSQHQCKSLRIRKQHYSELFLNSFPHECYFDSFASTQKDSETLYSIPLVSDIEVSETNLSAQLPYPLCPPILSDTIVDKCQTLVRDKQKYNKKLAFARKQIEYDKKWLTREHLRRNDETALPGYFLDFATGKTADVDQYFESDYDYYYTGGCLGKLRLGGEDYVVRPLEADQICFTNVSKPKQNYFLDTSPHTIYNINTYPGRKWQCLTIRQKRSLYLISVNLHDGNFRSKDLWSGRAKTFPYVDFKMSNTGSEVGHLNCNYELLLLDIDSNKSTWCQKFDLKNDKYYLGQFEFIDDDQMVFMSSGEVHLLDRRSKNDSKRRTVKEGFFLCNNLCGIVKDEYNRNYIYLTSKHDIMKFDLRQMNVVNKWSHLMTQSPIVGKLHTIRSNRYLCVSSFKEKICLCLNEHRNYIPFRMPSNKDTLQKMVLTTGVMVNDGLKKRMDMSVAGLELIDSGEIEEFDVYTTNTLGDVFRTHLAPDMPNNKQSTEILYKWSDELPEGDKPLTVTSMKNLRDLKRALMEPSESTDTHELRNKAIKEKLLKGLESTQKFEMSAIWSGGKVGIEGTPDSRPVTPTHKVTEWLQKTVQNDDSFGD